MDLSERYEQLIAFLTTHLPAPIEQSELEEGVIEFTGGSPAEVIARLTGTHVMVSEYSVKWETPFKPVATPRRVGTVNWRRLPESTVMSVVGQLIKGAREMRLSRYATCRYCEKRTPPEWMEADDICSACARLESEAIH
jgi:hypothetical protein